MRRLNILNGDEKDMPSIEALSLQQEVQEIEATKNHEWAHKLLSIKSDLLRLPVGLQGSSCNGFAFDRIMRSDIIVT